MKIAAFISDHGFGHAARLVALMEKLIDQRLDNGTSIQVCLVSSIPKDFFENSLGFEIPFLQDFLSDSCSVTHQNIPQILYETEKMDVGVHQEDSLTINLEKTLLALDEHWERVPHKVERLSAVLSHWKCESIVFDITALGPLVAQHLSIKSIGISNFSWDFIYYSYLPQYPAFDKYIKLHYDSYKNTSLLISYPYSCPMKAFDTCHRKELGCWVGRKAKLRRDESRKALGMIPSTKYILCSMGGHKFDFSQSNRVENSTESVWQIIMIDKNAEYDKIMEENRKDLVVRIKNPPSLCYVDILFASDVVLTKPGYGVVSESIINHVPVLYTERNDFIESGYLIEALNQCGTSKKVATKDAMMLNPQLFTDADTLLQEHVQKQRKETIDGNEVAAKCIIDFVVSNKY